MATSTDPKYNVKQPVKLVITRSCKSRVKEGDPLQDFAVGQEVTFTRQFGDELVSINKAVVVGSSQHEAWVEMQKKQKKEVKK